MEKFLKIFLILLLFENFESEIDTGGNNQNIFTRTMNLLNLRV